jgi:hypothetical protein
MVLVGRFIAAQWKAALSHVTNQSDAVHLLLILANGVLRVVVSCKAGL